MRIQKMTPAQIQKKVDNIRANILNKDYDHEQPYIPMGKDFTEAVKNLLKNFFADDNATVKVLTQGVSPTYIVTFPDNELIYISFGDFRYEQWEERILYRTMRHEKDYSGGMNHFADIFHLEEQVKWLVHLN